MPFTDEKRYPGLFSLRKRTKAKLPEPGANREVVPELLSSDAKAGLSLEQIKEIEDAIRKEHEGSSGTKARENLDWGGKKFAGGMTRDQFFTLAGGLAEAIAPKTPQGRAGGVLSKFGQQSMLSRQGMTETLRKEEVEKEKAYDKALLDIAKEERGYGHVTANTEIMVTGKEAAAKTLAGTKIDAARIKAAAKKLEGKESIRQFGVKEQRLRKEKGEKGLTTYQELSLESKAKAFDLDYRQDRFTFVEEDTAALTEYKDEYTPLQIEFGRNTSANKYDRAHLPKDKAQKNIRKRAVRSGKDETGQKVYANAYGEQFTDKACTKPYKPKRKSVGYTGSWK